MNYVFVRNFAFAVMSSLCVNVHAMTEDADAKNKITGLVVRPATLDDLPAVYEIDKEVTFEHFLPLMTQHYPQIYGNKTVEEGLNGDLKTDIETFQRCVTVQENERLHVAYDTEKKCMTGFVLSRKQDHVVNIDLLFVAKEYRRHGAAKKLFTQAVQAFSGVDQCYFYALDKNKAILDCIQNLGIECTPVNSGQQTDNDAQHPELYKHFSVKIASILAKIKQ